MLAMSNAHAAHHPITFNLRSRLQEGAGVWVGARGAINRSAVGGGCY